MLRIASWLSRPVGPGAFRGPFDTVKVQMRGGGTRQSDAGGDPHLVEDVAQVCFDRFLAERQLYGDLAVRPAIDDEPRDLELTFRQRLDAEWLAVTGPRPPIWSMAELP